MNISRLFLLAVMAAVYISSGGAVADDQPTPKRLPTIMELNQVLHRPYGSGLDREVELPVDKWLSQINDKGVPLQFDLSAIRRRGASLPELSSKPVRIPASPNITVGEVLRYILEGTPLEPEDSGLRLTYRVQEGKVLIVPEPAKSGGAKTATTAARQSAELADSTLLTMTLDGKTLELLLADMRRLTGANIIFDARQTDKAKQQSFSGSLSEVRLRDALRLMADTCDLEVVVVGSIYYVTSKENAERLQKRAERDRKGEINLTTGDQLSPGKSTPKKQ